MGFGTELQGNSSQEQLHNLQQFEIKLLQTIKACIQQRVKCERAYAQGLADMVNTSHRFENTFSLNTPLYKSWMVFIKETETIASMVKKNADSLSNQTLDKLAFLIDEKKSLKTTYHDEKKRLDEDLRKTKDDLQKLQGDYTRAMTKLHQEKSKYEEAAAKGKPGPKKESAKQKYMATTEKLHKTHNEYVLSLKEVNAQQRDYTRVLLPGLLDCHQEIHESMIAQVKDILLTMSSLTNMSDEKYAKCYSDIHKSANGIYPSGEYDDFLSKHRSDPSTNPKVEFAASLLENYTGTLKSSEIIVDELSEPHLQTCRKKFEERIELLSEKKGAHDKELQDAEAQLSSESEKNNHDEKNRTLAQKMKVVNLRREVSETHCHMERAKNLMNSVDEPLTNAGSAVPSVDLDGVKVGMPTASKDSLGDSSELGADGFSQSAKDKFNTMTSKMKKQFKMKRPSDPPKPPSKDFGSSNDVGGTENASETPGGGKVKKMASIISDQGYDTCEPSKHKKAHHKLPENNVGKKAKPWTIHDAQWFHGVLPRDEVVRLLENDGDYLVRESKNKKTGDPQYVLSVKWTDGKHFIIQGEEGNWRFEGDSFPTIRDLVNYQHSCGHAVTKKSQAILRKAILREEWELSNDDVTLGMKLGNGNFGDVYKGTYKKEDVAVKTCKETLSDDQKKKFLQEGRILKAYDHPNIVRFIGIAAQRQPVMIVMEFVPGGALLSFLRKMEKNPSIRVGAKALVQMCVDASAGMAYLEENNCIHRDLAARNCLVGKNNVVKISDFGMSREEEEYTVSSGLKQIPIKWTAPEALNYGTYTSACDVWSFGILMWEVFSFGNTPYSGLTNNQAREKVDQGYRMPAPEGTPKGAYSVMEQCWAEEPKNRPKFEKIHRDLTAVTRLL